MLSVATAGRIVVRFVSGYHAGLMTPAITSFNLGTKLDDVRALVAFIKARK